MTRVDLYSRSSDGCVIHRSLGCRWATKGTQPWHWADDMTTDEIINGVLAAGGVGLLSDLRFCYFCFGRQPTNDILRVLADELAAP